MSYCFCGKSNATKVFNSGDYRIVRCSCGQVRTVGGKRKTLYQSDDLSVYIEKESMFRQLFGQVVAFIKQFVTSGRLVDIGAGVGLLVDEANKAGFDAIGFEPSRPAVTAAKKRFGVTLKNSQFQKTKADIIVINHVLEHLENPKKLLAEISCRYLFIGVPNFGSIMSMLKRERWQNLIPDQHRWHFTRKTLDALVVPFGFRRVGERYENHDRGMHPWWKRPIYTVLDTIALSTGRGEAMLVAYEKI